MRTQISTSRRVLACILGFLATAFCADHAAWAQQSSLLTERMLPANTAVAVFIRDTGVTQQRWRMTVFYELLQTPEMKEMLAPLGQSMEHLTALDNALPTRLTDLAELLKGETAVGFIIQPTQGGIVPAAQIIIKPADAVKAKTVIDTWLKALAEEGAVMPISAENETSVYQFNPDVAMNYTLKNGVALFTIYPVNPPGGADFHSQSLGRMDNDGGSLAKDAEYALVRSKLGKEPEAWAYFGLFSVIARTPGLVPPPAQPFLAQMGILDVGGCIAGSTIEDRGFRTRLFVHQTGALRPKETALTPQDLALIPKEACNFGMGSMDLVGAYDTFLKILMLTPPDVSRDVANGIAQVQEMMQMNIRNDIFGMFGNRYLWYTTEAGSPDGGGSALFLSIRDKKTSEENLTKLLDAVSKLIQQQIGPNGAALLRARSIERGAFTQIYPQSVLPAFFTPHMLVSENWLEVGILAASALPKMRYFLSHEGSILDRPDFAKQIAKMPNGYYSISYNDSRHSFKYALIAAQFAADWIISSSKFATLANNVALPIDLNQLWPMDPGRFPDDSTIREKLFGAITVSVQQEDGLLIESFTPL